MSSTPLASALTAAPGPVCSACSFHCFLEISKAPSVLWPSLHAVAETPACRSESLCWQESPPGTQNTQSASACQPLIPILCPRNPPTVIQKQSQNERMALFEKWTVHQNQHKQGKGWVDVNFRQESGCCNMVFEPVPFTSTSERLSRTLYLPLELRTREVTDGLWSDSM